jgi:hypothetical protein
VLALLALAAAAGSVADAERAFAAKARAEGQWTAFRAFADPQAIMYAPGPVPVARLLAGKADPAASIAWAPARTITACDGTLAYSTGPWTRPDATPGGTFGTVWRRGAQGWRFVYEGGHDGRAMPAGDIEEDRAACPVPSPSLAPPADEPGARPVASLRANALAGLIEASDGPMPLAVTLGVATASGASADRTLAWRIDPVEGGRVGAHLLRLWSWDGRRYRLAVLDWSAGG